MDFVNNLKYIMNKLNLSNEEFAEKCGISYYKVNKWLNGCGCPSLKDLVKICKSLNIRANWLLGLED